MDLNGFNLKFKEIREHGFYKSMRRGPTGVGHTLEKCLGLIENNIAVPDLTLTVTKDAKQLKDGHLLLIEESGEIVLVNGDPSSDTVLTVVRAYSGTSAAAVTFAGATVNPNIFIIGNANEEGSPAPTAIAYDPTKKFNFTQIFRNTLAMTRTAQKTRLRTGDAVREAKREALKYHSEEMEKAFWFGKRVETTKNGLPIRTTGGILDYIDSGNVISQGGSATKLTDLEGWLEQAFRFGSSEKMGFLGNTAMLTIQQIIRKNASFELIQGQKEFGMNVSRLVTPFGTVILKTHPLWNLSQDNASGATQTYQGFASHFAIIDMDFLIFRPLDDTKFEEKLNANGVDALKSGFLTEAGIETHFPTAHFLIKGLNSATTDT